MHRQPHIFEEAAVDAPAAESSPSEADSQDSQHAEVDEQGVSPAIEAHSEMAASEVSGAHPDEAEERQPDSNASAPQNFAPNYNPTQKYSPRSDRGDRNDRGYPDGRQQRAGQRRLRDQRRYRHSGE